MLIQHSNYSVQINIIPRTGFGEESRRSILAAVEANLPGLSVTAVLVNEIPRNKAGKRRPVVSAIRAVPGFSSGGSTVWLRWFT